MSNSTSSQVISLPQGGGALKGIGEKFSPDLFTGTGNFTVPISLPPGRNGFQPQLNLVYSTGNGNGFFGLGWSLSIPGVSRKTSKGVPRYNDGAAEPEDKDVFILSGAEDLVLVENQGSINRYRPRTEGLFAKILYHRDPANSYWVVWSKDGLVSYYGTQASLGDDPAVIADPADAEKVFAWKLTHTEDPFGNRIEYEYERDRDEDGPHHWDQLYLKEIRYVDYVEEAETQFLVSVRFEYEDRYEELPNGERREIDPFSEYRSGFEIRTRKRCTGIAVRTHAGQEQLVRRYDLVYLDQRPELAEKFPINRVSLLSQIRVGGRTDDRTESLPPLEFCYTRFEPERRNFFPIQGVELPASSLANPSLELVDLFGNGLPDLLEMNGTVRYWRNLGGGCFDLPRMMSDAPAGLALADPGVQLLDANGDGRSDLLVTNGSTSGYFPLRFDGQWDRKSFRRYRQAPSFNLEDPEVKLIDLDGDGVTDALRSGSRLECFFNDPQEGWKHTRWVDRQALERFPNVSFSDPRVKWGDFTGDGLQTIALVSDGNVEYWPHLGRGKWGKRIHMKNSPRYPYGYDPRRILVGDVDGDGLADIVYVDDRKITLWINQSGNRWSDPITIQGTPPVSDEDAVRLVDLLGTGISGVLWSRNANGLSRHHLFFHDFTGGLKPYLLDEMDNHLGAVTKVGYAPSTCFYVEDQRRLATRWRTTLPFPVQVVSRVEVIDEFSRGKLTTQYHYHHGHWDGGEREFRGFGMVEQRDTETFETYDAPGLHGPDASFARVDRQRFSPPTLSKNWFHQGPVGDEFGDWEELDWSDQYWAGDPQLLRHTQTVNDFLRKMPSTPEGRRARRDALRALRGSMLRSELYALDGSERERRPYTVSESSYGLVEFEPPADGEPRRLHIFFPHLTAQRTTQWERGDDPLTRFSFTRYTDENNPEEFDPYGRPLAHTQVACPRGWRTLEDKPAESYLSTRTCSLYAEPVNPSIYIHDRVARATNYELVNTTGKDILDLAARKDSSAGLSLIGQTLNFYDGEAFIGLPLGKVGPYGVLTRAESLALTEEILQQAYGNQIPPYFDPGGNPAWSPDYPSEFRDRLPRRAGYTFHAGSADPTDPRGYFVNTERRRYDFQTNQPSAPRGLVLETWDPLHEAAANPAGHRTLITYDEYGLLPVEVTDAAGLSMQAVYDYRVMQPRQVTDQNGNQSRFTFSPLGLLESSYVRGKTATEGDQERPGVRLEFGFLAYENSPPGDRQPVFVRTIRQIHHDSELDVDLPARNETITTVEYSDGFGRLLQTRTQGEEVRFGDEHFGGGESVLPARQSDGPGGDVIGRRNSNGQKPNVVISGWQIYDNKGQVIEKYEPFFSTGWAYAQPGEQETGQKITMFYDPCGQAIRTLNPDQSVQLVIYGVPGTIAAPNLEHPEIFEPTPWEAYTYDANDNAGRTHPAVSAAFEHHWDTPASIVIDALGRTVEAVERNRDDLQSPIQEYRTRMEYDIRGNALAITDPLEREAFRHVYDCANRALRLDSIDAGRRQTVLDAIGGVVEQRDSRGAWVLHSYDDLNRPLRLWARDGADQKLTLRERVEYGDRGSPAQPAAERNTHRKANRLGQPHRHFDEAGLLTFEVYDFKGNLLEKRRQVVSDAAILAVFNGPLPGWQVDAYRVNWSTPTSVPLDGKRYTTTMSYDALNRVKIMTYPQDVDDDRRKLIPYYNRAGALERVALDGDLFVERIAYNAKGQRVLIAYGSGIMTRYAYDSHNFRLLHLRTERYTKPAELAYRRVGQPLQEFGYKYDLVGSIWQIHNRTPGCGIFNLGEDVLDREFRYDAIHRLLYATGRESTNIPSPRPWSDAHREGFNANHHGTPNQGNAPHLARFYTEEYRYDPAGNLVSLRHQQEAVSWTRYFGIGGYTPQQWGQAWKARFNAPAAWEAPPGNQLTHVGDDQMAFLQTHVFDKNGNLNRESTSRHFEWDYADRMRVYRTQAGASEPSVHAHYLYDAGGQRVKKLVRHQGGQTEVTVYIDSIFEHHIKGDLQNNTLHVMDNRSRIALLRAGPAFPGDGAASKPVQYHLGDHLGSSHVVVGGATAEGHDFVNCEEYTPYGETSFGSFGRKRYRFTGKERDEESGLYYHSARYYAPGLARWISYDPAGPVDGVNLYPYTCNNPILLVDPYGTESGTDATTRGVNEIVCVRDEMVNGVKYLEFANPEDTAPDGAKDGNLATPGPGPTQNHTPTSEKVGTNLTSTYQGDDPSPAPSKANSDTRRPGFKEGSREWGFLDDLATLGAILGNEWDPDKIPASEGNGGIPGGKIGNKSSPAAQVLYFSIQLISLIGFARVARMVKMGGARTSRSATAALFKLLKGSPKPKVVYSYGGDFSITPQGWAGYPSGYKKPPGTFNFLDDAEYEVNRAAANAANKQINEVENLGVWSEIHEVKPVRFGGSPTDYANKDLLSPPEHWKVSAFWRDMQRWITGK